jgi:hypothetical protein
VEPFLPGPVVFRACFLAQGLQHRADRRRAPGGQVAADDRRPAEGGAELKEPVFELAVRVAGAGLPLAPALGRAARDHRQVIQRRPGRGGVEQDPIGLGPHLIGELPGPVRDRERQRTGDVTRRQRGIQQRPLAEPAHLPDRGPRPLLRHPRPRRQPG